MRPTICLPRVEGYYQGRTVGGGSPPDWHSIARFGCRKAWYPSHVHARHGSVIAILIAARHRLRYTCSWSWMLLVC